MSLIGQQQRGVMAKQILDNPIYQEAIILTKAEILTSFENSAHSDDDARRESWALLKALSRIEKQIEKIMKNGAFAEKELERKPIPTGL
jgi:hypothetical protein